MAANPPTYPEDEKNHPTIIHLDGRTGGGKSAVANAFYKLCVGQAPGHAAGQAAEDPFLESTAAASCTQVPKVVTIESPNISLVDNPGLGDTEGVQKDSINLQKSIQVAQEMKYLNVELIVLEAQNIRFDAPLQDMILLKVNSFGTKVLNHLGFIINKCPLGMLTPQAARQRIDDFATILCTKLGIPVSEFPFWMLECHPELLTNLGVSAERIVENVEHTKHEMKLILDWAKGKPNYFTADAKVAEYKLVQEARESKEKAAYMKKYTESWGVIRQGYHNWKKTTPATHSLFGRTDCVHTCPCGASHKGDGPPNGTCESSTVRGFKLPTWEAGGRLTSKELEDLK